MQVRIYRATFSNCGKLLKFSLPTVNWKINKVTEKIREYGQNMKNWTIRNQASFEKKVQRLDGNGLFDKEFKVKSILHRNVTITVVDKTYRSFEHFVGVVIANLMEIKFEPETLETHVLTEKVRLKASGKERIWS